MFPTTDDSQTIIDCFLNEIKQYNIEVLYQSSVEKIDKIDNGFNIHLSNSQLSCSSLIIATGGFHIRATNGGLYSRVIYKNGAFTDENWLRAIVICWLESKGE